MAKTQAILDDRMWRRFLNQVGSRLGNPLPKLAALAKTMGYKDIISHFDKEESPSGKWQAWSSRYAQYARKRGQRKILQNTGNLRQSITNLRTVNRNSVEIFTHARAPYAAKHNYGLEGMPKREFMWLSDRTMKNMASAVLQWMAQ